MMESKDRNGRDSEGLTFSHTIPEDKSVASAERWLTTTTIGLDEGVSSGRRRRFGVDFDEKEVA
jgi:hypothetical protein